MTNDLNIKNPPIGNGISHVKLDTEGIAISDDLALRQNGLKPKRREALEYTVEIINTEDNQYISLAPKKLPAELQGFLDGEYRYEISIDGSYANRKLSIYREALDKLSLLEENESQIIDVDLALECIRLELGNNCRTKCIINGEDVHIGKFKHLRALDFTNEPTRDPDTGALWNIVSPVGLDYIRQKIQGPFKLIFLDVNGAGAANAAGFAEQVDNNFQTIVKIAQNIFGKNSIIARLGGDEFAIVAPFDDKSELKIKAFKDEIEENRRKQFPDHLGSESFKRSVFKLLSILNNVSDGKVGYYLHKVGFTNLLSQKLKAQIYSNYRNNLKREYVSWRDSKGKNPVEFSLWHSRKKRDDKKDSFRKSENSKIMSVDMATVTNLNSPQSIKLTDLFSMQIQASRYVGESKKTGNSSTSLETYDSSIRLRDEEAEAIKGMIVKHNRDTQLLGFLKRGRYNDLYKVAINKYLEDENLAQRTGHELILRFDLIQDKKVLSFFPEFYNKNLQMTKFEIHKFASYNSVFDYAKADYLSEEFFKRLKDHFTESLIIKDGGGDYFVISTRNRDLDYFQEVQRKLNSEMSLIVRGLSEGNYNKLAQSRNNLSKLKAFNYIKDECDKFAVELGLTVSNKDRIRNGSFIPGEVTFSQSVYTTVKSSSLTFKELLSGIK